MDQGPKRPTRSVEDYLKAIYSLNRAGGPATTSAIAEHLAIQPASVTGMVKRLADRDLLTHEPSRGVVLTGDGVQLALRVIRRHRILELYLTERLGYAWEDVHDEAERLEHAASDRLVEAMAEALGDPSHDPHGAPIPTPEGRIARMSTDSLADAPLNEAMIIQAVRDDQAEGLRAMQAFGLLPGVRVEVVERETETGVRVRIAGGAEATHVPQALAQRIFVEAEA